MQKCETWSLTLTLFKTRKLRKTFGLKEEGSSRRLEKTAKWDASWYEYYLGDPIKVDEKSRACGTYKGKEKCMQSFNGEKFRKETTWKT